MRPTLIGDFHRYAIGAAMCTAVLLAGPAWGRQPFLLPEERGDCPGSPPVSAYWPEITAPAIRHDVDLQGTEPARTLRLIAWRVPCANSPNHHQLFLRMSTQASGGKFIRFPRFTVVQNNVELGSFSSQSGPTTNRKLVIEPTQARDRGAMLSILVSPLVSENSLVRFDPMQRLTLYVRPEGWPAERSAVRVDIPAANEPGNHGFVPRQVAGQWWNPARPGWGLTLSRNERETVFATWLTYDDSGNTTWFVMPYSESTPDGEIKGAVYAPQGRPFGPPELTPVEQRPLRIGEQVGTFGLRFLDADNALFTIDIHGVRRTEPIQRQRINASNGKPCDADSGAHHDPRVNGWGIGMEGSLRRADCATQLTFLTYDVSGRPVWYFASMIPTGRQVQITIPSTFIQTLTLPVVEGDVYRPRGTPWRLSSMTELAFGAVVGRIETPKLDSGAGMQIRIGTQEAMLLPEPLLFEF